MLIFGIRYLNGVATASDHHDRDSAEWPPHPGRVFMAMAAAYFETCGPISERAALEWLETQESPLMYAPDVQSRAVVEQFVPVNPRLADETKARKKEQTDGKNPPPPLQSAPGVIRTRQSRTFASTWLGDDNVWLMWPEVEPPTALREGLATLCAKVTRIGHSSSLVHMWLDDSSAARPPNWVPDEGRGVTRLRIMTPGTLADLERCFNASAHEAYAELLVAADDDRDKLAQKVARVRLKNEFGGNPPPRHRPQLSITQGYVAPVSGEKALGSVTK
jgi:CRISPR-associated protein Csb2